MTPSAEEVRRRIVEVLGVPEARVPLDAILTDLVYDSYRLVELAIDLQDDYDVIFTQDDLQHVNTVGDLVELVRSRAGPS